MLARREFELAFHFVGLHDEAAVRTVFRPVAQRVEILRRVEPRDRAERVERIRDFVRPHDRPRFVDPNGSRHIDHVVEFGDDVPRVY